MATHPAPLLHLEIIFAQLLRRLIRQVPSLLNRLLSAYLPCTHQVQGIDVLCHRRGSVNGITAEGIHSNALQPISSRNSRFAAVRAFSQIQDIRRLEQVKFHRWHILSDETIELSSCQ